MDYYVSISHWGMFTISTVNLVGWTGELVYPEYFMVKFEENSAAQYKTI